MSSNSIRPYRRCVRCIMDTSDPDIVFDGDGVCNHCHRYERVAAERLVPEAERQGRLSALASQIRSEGKGKPYDCIIGVSGGVDSTYLAYVVKRQLGLRPLAVHLDNGWDSELAVSNIEKTLKALEIDLYTYVIDWEEFRDLQIAFLKGSTPDGEVPTDHAISAVLYERAAHFGVRYILLGTNVVTEAILPVKWGYGYFDFRYIKDVHRRFGQRPLRTYPHFSLFRLFWYLFRKRIRSVSILNYIHYDKAAAMALIQGDLGWKYYGGKHYESIYTRFYQAYVLPRKFDIDKRKAHYSNLVCSGQLTREKALEMLAEPVCPEGMLAEDRDYVIKKLSLTESEFEALLAIPARTFLDYRTSYRLFELAKRVVNKGRRLIG